MTAGEPLTKFVLLASAIAGRTLAVVEAPGDASCWSDGTAVYVPAGPADQQRAQVALHAALLRQGSLDRARVRRLVGRSGAARRYLALEVGRAASGVLEGLPRLVSSLGVDDPSPSPSADDSLQVALGRSRLREGPAWWGSIRPSVLARAKDEQASPQVDLPKLDLNTRPNLDPNQAASDQGLFEKIFDSPGASQGRVAKAMRKLFGDDRDSVASERSSASTAGAAAEASFGGRAGGVGTVVDLQGALDVPSTPSMAVPALRVQRFPEWDAGRGRLLPDWCRVLELPAASTGAVPSPATDPTIRRQLARVGLAPMTLRRQPAGAELDLDAVVDSQIDAACGFAAQRNLYRDVRPLRTDLGVLVLLDASGSAADRGADGGLLHEHQLAATATLVDTLVSLGVRVAVHSFSTMGREDVRVTRLRRFDEHGSAAFRSRLGGVVPEAYTRLGAAIRHGGHVLEHEAGTGAKLLVVVSDGYTHDHGYEGAYGQADAARSIEEVRSRGMGCLCLALGGTDDPGRLARVFGPAAYAVADDLEDLRRDIRVLFQQALAGADTRRRFAPAS